MFVSIIFFTFLGFGLGLWIGLFGLLAVTVLVFAGALSLALPLVSAVSFAAAFQLAAFAGMAVRFGFTRRAARRHSQSPAARRSPSPAPHDHDAVAR